MCLPWTVAVRGGPLSPSGGERRTNSWIAASSVFSCSIVICGCKKLARIRTSVPDALERLERIRVGRATVGQQTVPFLTNVSKPARECYEQLGVSIPRVSDVAEVATANLWYETSPVVSCNPRRISTVAPFAC